MGICDSLPAWLSSRACLAVTTAAINQIRYARAEICFGQRAGSEGGEEEGRGGEKRKVRMKER